MERPRTVVVSDETILPEICGANDSNLKVFEEILGVRVFSRGNEILLDTVDDSVERTFTLLLEQLEDHIRLGQLPGPDLIRSIHGSLASGDTDRTELLKSTLVVVPGGQRKVYPRTLNQAHYLHAIETGELTFGVGPAGTGKTYLAVAMAAAALAEKRVRRIVLTRPAVEAGERLGFLPGDMVEKVNPYLRPVYDALYDILGYEKVARHLERGVIEVAPLAFMRGRTLNDSFILLDEAQNTTPEQMKMFLTRLGFHSKAVITGDVTQIDLPNTRASGLIQAREILGGLQGICFFDFAKEDVVRHRLVEKVVAAYELFDAQRQKADL